MSSMKEAMAQQDEVRRLAARNDGRVTPKLVVDTARDKKSPLHPYFEWDDRKAGEVYRLDQARTLIRSVVITQEPEIVRDLRVPNFVRDPDQPPDKQGYISIARVRSDEDAARAVLLNEFGYAASALQRARNVAAALDLEGEVGDIISRVERTRDVVRQKTVPGPLA